MHLLHDGLGGRATDSNLVPAKSRVNTNFYNKMEKFAQQDINPPKNKVLWYSVKVNFHPVSPADGVKGIDYSGYPKSVVAKYGHLDYSRKTKKWAKKPASPKAFTDSDIEIPNFGKAVNRVFNPNKDGWKNLMAMEDADKFASYHISASMARFINNERNTRGKFTRYDGSKRSKAFVSRMNIRKGKGGKTKVPTDFNRAMSLIDSLHKKSRFKVK